MTFSHDGTELYFTRAMGGRNAVFSSRQEGDGWTPPEEATFSSGFDTMLPHLSHDGRRLIVNAERPRPDQPGSPTGLWIMDRGEDGRWGEPWFHSASGAPSTAGNGNLYVTAFGSDGGGVVIYEPIGRGYGRPRVFEGAARTPRCGSGHNTIAPDESYILFHGSEPDGHGGQDLLVCFRGPDGTWSGPRNLGEPVNGPGDEWITSITPDGEFIFYSSDEDIYWVSSRILDPLREEALGPTLTGDAAHVREQEGSEFLPGVTGDYLGQTPPGTEFRRFAPGIVPADQHSGVSLSPDGREIYWTERNGIVVTRRVGDRWTVPEYLPFSGPSDRLAYDDVPVVSPDNRRLYFLSQRPVPFPTGNREHIWFAERTPSGWSEPSPLPPVVNSTPGIHWNLSLADSGTLYFGVMSPEGGIGVFFSRKVDGVFQPPEPINVINSQGGGAFCPFIAPDESYIVFSKLDESLEFSEGHFISFRDGNGIWLPPRKLPEFPESEGAFVSRDGLFLFSKNYWVSARIIENLRPTG